MMAFVLLVVCCKGVTVQVQFQSICITLLYTRLNNIMFVVHFLNT